MVVLGIVLLAVGAGLGVMTFVGVRGASTTVSLSALGFSRAAQPLEIFLVGAAAVLLFCVGWALVAAALRRRALVRREDRERERITAVEHEAESQRLEHERRLEEAGLRDEDLQRREDDLEARHRQLEDREQEVARLEAAYREKVGPSVADVVTGRAEGRVSEGTAAWTDPTAPVHDAARPLPRTGHPGGDS